MLLAIHIYLDELNLYDYIDSTLASMLPEIAQIHLFLYSMNYQLALDLIKFSHDPESLIFEKLLTNYFLGVSEIPSIDVFDVDGDDSLSLFSFNEEAKEELMVFINTISFANSLIDSIYTIEKYQWKKTMKKFIAAGISYCVAEPILEDVEMRIQELDSFIYSFQVFGYSLIWVKNSRNGKLSVQ